MSQKINFILYTQEHVIINRFCIVIYFSSIFIIPTSTKLAILWKILFPNNSLASNFMRETLFQLLNFQQLDKMLKTDK